MSAYELGIKAYHENEFLMENPFKWGSSNYDLWEEGWWDGWFETNFPSK